MKLAKPETLGFSSSRLERLNRKMQRHIDERKFAGIVTLIARRGKLAHLAAFGQQDIEADKAMKTDTLFRIYSMTKPITTVAAMMLYEEGALRLTDPVANFIPAFANTKVCVGSSYLGMVLEPQATPITIRQLMTHTSGLSYGWFQDSPADAVYREFAPKVARDDLTLAEFVDVLAEAPLVFQPGTAWRYSYSTDVLGRVVEVVSGMTLREFFHTRILEPLGMEDTDYQIPDSKLKRYATCYGPGLQIVDPPINSQYTRRVQMHNGGHGLISTAGDYLRFCQMILNQGELDGVRLLGRKSVELMTANHIPPGLPFRHNNSDISGQGFGLGFSVILDPAAHQMLGSAGTVGWGGAANTTFWIDPKEELIGILMTQFMPSYTYPLVADFQTLAYQALVE